MRRLIALLTLTLTLAACGIKGNLVRPSDAGKSTPQTQQNGLF